MLHDFCLYFTIPQKKRLVNSQNTDCQLQLNASDFDNKWHHLDCALITPWPLTEK